MEPAGKSIEVRWGCQYFSEFIEVSIRQLEICSKLGLERNVRQRAQRYPAQCANNCLAGAGLHPGRRLRHPVKLERMFLEAVGYPTAAHKKRGRQR